MRKFKLLLVIFLLPITYIIYYLTSEEYGVSAYIEKKKNLEAIFTENKKIQKDISIYSHKIRLLSQEIPDIDLLDEKALELLAWFVAVIFSLL